MPREEMSGKASEEVSVRFGALAPPISKQVKLPDGEASRIDKMASAITLLYLHDILTARETETARQRLLKKVAEVVRRA